MYEAHKMAAFSRVALLLLICWIQHCSAQNTPPSTFTISPSTIQLTPNTTSTGTTVTVTCGPPSGSGSITLLALSIRRQLLNSQTSTELTKAVAGKNNNEPRPVAPMPGATASGSLGENVIRLVMTQAKCGYQGTYSCEALYSSSGGAAKATSEAVLNAEVSPGQLDLSVTPEKQQWAVNETMNMSCTGPVGSVNTTGGTNDPQIIWHWEHKRPGLSWQAYDEPSGDINNGPLGTRSCYKTQTSTLTRHLSIADSGSTYRCYAQYAAEHYVGTVTADGTTPPATTSEDNSSDSRCPTCSCGQWFEGFGAGLGVGLAILVVVVSVILLCLWRRQWKLPCAAERPSNKSADNASYILAAHVESSLGTEMSASATSGTGPYEELKQSDIGLRSEYSQISGPAPQSPEMDGGYEIPLQRYVPAAATDR